MFKRIVKIVGFVLLGFVLLIGGVVGFMALRGDFEKKVIKPKAVKFNVSETKLVYDAVTEDESVYSFTISSDPIDATETECSLTLSSPLITFVKKENGKWVKNTSSVFHLNQPIYFVVNDVVDNTEGKENVVSEQDYFDGLLKITVYAGLPQDSIILEIDRNVTSVSFKDNSNNGNNDNNKISDGLFGYELAGNGEPVVQKLEAIMEQDYPLEVISAPLKAAKPFASKAAKEYDIYLVKDGQQRRLTHQGEKVVLKVYNNEGIEINDPEYPECEFLKYDVTNSRYILNSKDSGEYQFLLAMYPTYDIQQELQSDSTLSFSDRLKTGKMITKTVVITVNGTEAEKIAFESSNQTISMNLLQDNQWVANNSQLLNVYNLGLTLSKEVNSNIEILGRYGELKFLNTNESFDNNISLKFKQAETEVVDGNIVVKKDKEKVVYKDSEIKINFFNDRLGNKRATISGIDNNILKDYANVEYNAKITGPIDGEYYTLLLSYEVDADTTIVISLPLKSDSIVGKELSFVVDGDADNLIEISIDKKGNQSYEYLSLSSANCLILGDKKTSGEEEYYDFKTLKSGLYLAIVGNVTKQLLNDKFISTINYDDANTLITIKPIDSALALYSDMKLYGIVVNTNGSFKYTDVCRSITVSYTDTQILVEEDFALPVSVDEGLNLSAGKAVTELVHIQRQGSYGQGQVLLFVPEYSLLNTKPSTWGKGIKVYTNNGGDEYQLADIDKDTIFDSNTYYVKNNYRIVDMINFKYRGVKYYLVGYVENKQFINKVVATDINYDSKLYPVIVKTKYLLDEGRLQTAEEYVMELLTGKIGNSLAKLNGQDQYVNINYDLTLLPDRHIKTEHNSYIETTAEFSASKTYYAFNDESENFEEAVVSPEDINNWGSMYRNYYEAVSSVKASDVMGEIDDEEDKTKVNIFVKYYTLQGEELSKVDINLDDTDFIENWKEYYVIVSHYMIGQVTNDGTNITIEAFAVSNDKKLDVAQTFVLTVDDYNDAKQGKGLELNIDNGEHGVIYYDKGIKGNSYYDFDASSITPRATFAGSYFDNESTKVGNEWNIISEHKTISLGWDETENEPISSKSVQTGLYINSGFSAEILQHIVSYMSVRAIEYNSSDVALGDCGAVSFGNNIRFEYVRATAEYNETFNYYITVDGGQYKPVTILDTPNDENDWEITADEWAEIIINWNTQHANYYVAVIVEDFEVNNIIADGRYVKIEWTYNAGNTPYKIYSQKLNILSRDVKGYEIDLQKEEVKRAVVLGQAEAPEEYYHFDKEINEFTLVDDSNVETYPYEPNKYYSLEESEYFGTIKYLVEVWYNNGYNYQVYAMDESGNNYLYYNYGTNDSPAYKSISAGSEIAFSLSPTGWIKPKPFYADSIMSKFTITGNDNLVFNKDGENNIISFAQESEGYSTVTLKSADTFVSYVISAKVDINDKFSYTPLNVTPIKQKSYAIPENTYTYDGIGITKELDLTISVVGANYQVVKEDGAITVKNDDGDTVLTATFNSTQWVINRNSLNPITINLEIKNVLGTYQYILDFVKIFDIGKSTTNKTNVIYSGTTFVLAKSNIAAGEEETIYTLTPNDGGQFIVEYYKAGGDKLDSQSIKSKDNKFILTSVDDGDDNTGTMPIVNTPTLYHFELYYNVSGEDEANAELVGQFDLTVAPNVLIQTNLQNEIELNDYNNRTYEFVYLNISSYKDDKEYTTYTNEDLNKFEDLSGFSYYCETYVDAQYQTKYTTNVFAIENHKLEVNNPISQTGTYYVKVKVFKDGINAGEVKFKISTLSSVVSSSDNDVEPIEITAKTEMTYTLDQLQEKYDLKRNGGTIEDSIELSDILWIHHECEDLIITYTYQKDGYIYNLTQYGNQLIYKVTYDGETQETIYKFIGTSYKMEKYTYNMAINGNRIQGVGDPSTEVIGNIEYIKKDGIALYCTQNAYLFKNGNEILAISAENSGKKIYKFTINDTEDEKNVTLNSQIEVGKLYALTIKYDSYGKDLSANANTVDYIEYSIETIFANGDAYTNIKTDDIYSIDIKPYIINPETSQLLYETVYVLYDSGTDAANKGLFNIDGDSNIKAISFGRGDDYKLGINNNISNGTTYSIELIANGNNDVVTLPVTITYSDNSTFTYNVNIYAINKNVVEINYIYNVEESADEYEDFNMSISDLTNTIDGYEYDATDFASWIGINTSEQNWQNNRVKYDLALKRDTINLNNEYILEGIKTYNLYTYEYAEDFDVGTNYYVYDTSIKAFKSIDLESQPEDWNKFKYYVRNVSANTQIEKIEIVAVSSTFVSDPTRPNVELLDNLNECVALNPNTANGATITISNELYSSGYVLFKLYAKDCSAYGYYLVKIIAEEQFNGVYDDYLVRRTEKITHKLDNTNTKIMSLITNIDIVADIHHDLVENDYSNVYLFMLDSEVNITGSKPQFNIDGENKSIENGRLIPHNAILVQNQNIQTIKIAVVLKDGSWLVRVCNYTLILQPNVEVTPSIYNKDLNPDGMISAIEDESYHIYSARPVQYSYSDGNIISFDGSYFTVTNSEENMGLSTIELVDNMDKNVTIDSNQVLVGGTAIAQVIGTNQLQLLAPVSENRYFYIKLVYGEGESAVSIYLRITLKKFEFKTTNRFDVGVWNGTEFNRTFELSNVFGDYNGDYSLKYSSDNINWVDSLDVISSVKSGEIIFKPQINTTRVYLSITLKDVVEQITKKDILITLQPSIKETYANLKKGASYDNRIVANSIDYSATALSQEGSKLHVKLDDTSVKLQDAGGDDYLTINANYIQKVEFSLTTDAGQDAPYFITGVETKQSRKTVMFEEIDDFDINFAHSAVDKNLKLNIKVYNAAGAYETTYSVYIVVPKTYELKSVYRVNGAQFESVVNNDTLLLEKSSDKSIKTNFFGTESTAIDDVNQSRIQIKIGETLYYGYDNIVALGLLDGSTDIGDTELFDNPNKLRFDLQVPQGINMSGISLNRIKFASDDDAPTNTLVLSNDTCTINYVFLVLTAEADYSKVQYNENLLLNATDGEVSNVTVTHQQLQQKDINGNYAFELAYLKYVPNNDIGQLADVKIYYMGSKITSLKLKVERGMASGYASKIVVDEYNLASNGMYVYDLYIVTMNGIASKVKLVISDINISYGYSAQESDNKFETSYAGYDIGKINGYDTNNQIRVTAKIEDDTKDIFSVEYSDEYSVEYKGALQGFAEHMYWYSAFDYAEDDTSVVWYDVKGIRSRTVANDTDVTLVFDITYDDNIIGRIYYKLRLLNSVEIGLNPNIDLTGSINLYLGSSIYTIKNNGTEDTNDDETVIDLLNGSYEGDKFRNNIFVTLKTYSNSDSTVFNNGKDIVITSNVSEYLRFAVTEGGGGIVTPDIATAENPQNIKVDENGKLYIKGNPSGTFALSAYSAKALDCGTTFTITVHKFDKTTSLNTVDRNGNAGYASGTQIKLFNSTPDKSDKNDYAFNSYRLGFDYDNGTTTSQIIYTPATLKYQVMVFDNESDIKNLDKWTSSETVEINENIDSISLPSVKYSNETTEQIVSYRLSVTYNGQTSYYYSSYLVYNPNQIIVNKLYAGSQVVTYGKGTGAWTSSNTITIMNNINTGMYASVTPIVNETEFNGLTFVYTYLESTGIYDEIPRAGQTYEPGTYFKLNDIVNNIENYTAWIRQSGKDDNEVTLNKSDTTIEGTLPRGLFTNYTDCQLVIKSNEGVEVLVHDWRLQANIDITPKATKPIKDFFLESEVGQSLYNENIIAITSGYDADTYKGFVSEYEDNISVPESLVDDDKISLINGYELHRVKYTYDTGEGSVFTVEKELYVLCHTEAKAISVKFEVGTYLTKIVDDSTISDNSTTINLNGIAQLWKYADGDFIDIEAEIDTEPSGYENITIDGTTVTLNNIHKLTTSPSIYVTINAGGASRSIEIYFNIIISPKTLGAFEYKAVVGSFMGGETSKTIDYNSNTQVKAELLKLIKFNGQNVPENAISYSNYKIDIKSEHGFYHITYTYKGATATYTRTFKMSTT